MSKEISKTQVDRLGDRLKKGNITEDDLRLLDQYRRSYTEAYELVVGSIRRELGLEPTGRPAKSTTSISDKLRRESIRLTQIQDIAGCRLIVSDIAEQDRVVESLSNLFERVSVIDRRQQPSHGYRAVHVIAGWDGKLIEIQVRTELQHLWAELSEKLSDLEDPAIKYGGGDETTQRLLASISKVVTLEEKGETLLLSVMAGPNIEESDKVNAINERQKLRRQTFELLQDALDKVSKWERKKDALLN